jgi:8-oxo-dGTP diphosphatase
MNEVPRRFEELDWSVWNPRWRATLMFIRGADGRLLLIEKKRGLGAGKVNAPGGRLEPGETPLEAAIREVREEVRVEPYGVREAGRLQFQFVDGLTIDGAVFTAEGCHGVPEETDEAVPFWCAPAELPYDRMWADDRIWIPDLLAGRPFHGRFLFDGDAMLGYEMQ